MLVACVTQATATHTICCSTTKSLDMGTFKCVVFATRV